jgi:hypothetical protein
MMRYPLVGVHRADYLTIVGKKERSLYSRRFLSPTLVLQLLSFVAFFGEGPLPGDWCESWLAKGEPGFTLFLGVWKTHRLLSLPWMAGGVVEAVLVDA